MKNLINEYNEKEKPPVKLELAYGMAEFNCASDDPQEKQKLADERMYAHKKALKAGVAI